MANQTDTYCADSKFTGVNVLPENLLIVGIDIPAEAMPDLADPDRIHLPIDDLVASIATHGVREPVKIRKYREFDRAVVIAGRRRVRAAREVNSRLADDCKVLVPCVPEDKTFDPLTALVIENEHRVNDTPLARARKAGRMKARGASDADICATFGITKSGLRVWWSVLEAQPVVQRAVERGQITMAVAVELAKLPVAEQSAAVAQAIESGRSGATLENVRAARKASKGGNGHDAPRRLPLAGMKKFAATLESVARPIVTSDDDAVPTPPEEVRVGFGVVSALLLGDASALDPWPALRHAFDVATAPKNTGVADA